MNQPDAMRPCASRSKAFTAIGGQVALLALLTGCASAGTDSPVFDYAPLAAEAAAATPVKASGKTEKPKVKSAQAILGAHQTGPGYRVQPDVTSDGRYNAYIFVTERKTYSVTGDDLARQHIQELIALDMLKQYSKAKEFAGGMGNAVVRPVKAVVNTVTDPVGTAEGAYTNVKRKVASVQRGVSEAGEFVTTFGNPEQKRPDRESDSLLEKIVDRPKAKRRLARDLKVDPYTHFVPLADELDKVASYSAAGEFGIDRAVGFVPGAAGLAISGIQTLDSLTTQTLDMDPEEIAAVNRDRLEKLDVPKDIIKKLMLNDKLTPTEKTQAVGYLDSLSGTPGLTRLASFIATSDNRRDAFAALLTLGYLSMRPFGEERIGDVEIVERTPILSIGERRVAIFSSDDLAWTASNADHLTHLIPALKSNGKGGPKKEIWISGSASRLAERELQRQGWIVKTDAFRSLR